MLNEIYIDKVKSIENAIASEIEKTSAVSLMTGLGGLALFYADLYQTFGEDTYLKKAERIIDKILVQISTNEISHTYCDGLAGVGYLFNYLQQSKLLSEEFVADFLKDVDDLLYQRALQQLDGFRDVDLLHGSVGIAWYLISRKDSNRQINVKITELIHKIAELIYAEIKGEIQIFGSFVNDKFVPNTNLGMAHGLIAIMVVFSKFVEFFPTDVRIEEILSVLTAHVLGFQSDSKDTASLFPGVVRGDEIPAYNIPLGWCYGDGTASLAIYRAGKALGSIALLKEAEKIAMHSTHRNTSSSAFVRDACFCHGTSSIAQIHKVWFDLTGNPAFKKSYLHWINETIAIGNFSDGIGGYKKLTQLGESNNENTYKAEVGLLDGAAGIGLVLNDFLKTSSSSTLHWEQFFLLR